MLENGQMMAINIRDILPNRFQPRIHFEEGKIQELAESIKKYGLIQPIVVRQIGSKYEIISGERRFKASFLAKKETIPAIVVNLTDRECEEIALLENIQRQDLTPIEEAVSFKRILDVGYVTQEQLAAKVGKSQSFIANKIRLLNLDDDVQDALLYGKISERHARSLLKIHNHKKQVEMLNRIIEERMTVKMTDKAIKEMIDSGEIEKEETKEKKSSLRPKEEIETLVVEKKKPKPAKPVGSHKIIKVSPPKDLEEILRSKERGASFMDIDKILEEAKDITPNEEPKAANDIADLMKQDPTNVPSPLISSEPVNNEPVANELPLPTPQNRFVSVPTEMPSPETPAPEVSMPAPAVNFDSVFNQSPMPGFNSQPNMMNPGMPNMMNNMNDFNNQGYAPAVNQEMPMNNVNPINNATPPLDMVGNMPMEPNLNQNIGMENSFNNMNGSVMPSPAMPDVNGPLIPNNNQVSMDNFVSNLTPSNEMLQNNIPTVNIPEQNLVSDNLNGIANPQAEMMNPGMPPLNIPNDDIIEDTNFVNSMLPGGEKDFKQVLNIIRNCSSEIEKLGYFIDVDEVDNGDSYQVTFKINKE